MHQPQHNTHLINVVLQGMHHDLQLVLYVGMRVSRQQCMLGQFTACIACQCNSGCSDAHTALHMDACMSQHQRHTCSDGRLLQLPLLPQGAGWCACSAALPDRCRDAQQCDSAAVQASNDGSACTQLTLLTLKPGLLMVIALRSMSRFLRVLCSDSAWSRHLLPIMFLNSGYSTSSSAREWTTRSCMSCL